MMHVCLHALALLWLIFAFTSVPAAATSKVRHTRDAQKQQAEAERAELQQKLKTLKNAITKTETAKDQANDALASSEEAISEANRSLHDLQAEQAQTEAHLQQLIEQRDQLTAKVNQQKKQLSDFLRQQYMRGNSDRLQLLLSGDNPNRINRELQYMSYISQTQAKMIGELRVTLAEVEKNTEEAQDAKEALDEIAQEQREHKVVLEGEKKRRATLLNQLADKLHAQKKQADNLQKDEQRLSSLVTQLERLIVEQRKAAQEKADALEKQRQAKRVADKLRRDKALAAGGKNPGKGKASTDAIDDDEPPKSTDRNELTPSLGSNDGAEFARLKGQLRLPVKGDLIAKFGTRRGDGPSWKGLFIKATEGAEIKAIASGKVVFAEWLRGFGNMIIVDHGGQYLSLYSNNQAVLKHAGDSVKSGEVIATAGNSGGNEESGLYFELRHQGRVFDPLTWVTIR